MYTDYLKEMLQKIVGANADAARIEAEAEQYEKQSPGSRYPYQTGALEATVACLVRNAESALRWTNEHVVPAEAEAQRLISALENVGIDIDADTMRALELMGKKTYGKDHWETSPYKYERRELTGHFSRIVNEVLFSERESEHDHATDTLTAGGFEYDEDSDTFSRGAERVTITLESGRECRYSWVYERETDVLHIDKSDAGKSGEFHRLLSLINPLADALAPFSLGKDGAQPAATGKGESSCTN